MTQYRSKIDVWFVIIYAVLAWRLGWPVVSALLAGRAVSSGLVIAAATVLGGVAYVAATTRYALTDEALIVRCGPFRSTIALGAIYKLRASSSLLASPALSLDRIEVLASPGPYVLISPADKALFLKDILARAPRIQLEGLDPPA
jgi:hypothetical protein